MNLHFIHGFLGLPDDWQQFEDKFLPNSCIFHSIDNFLPNLQYQDNYFKIWAKNFNAFIFEGDNFKNKKNILIGYSLGGRLALHSLLEKNYWDGIVIISANPGLTNEEENRLRIRNDENWASKFLNEPWDSVISAWNSQGVFSGQKNSLNRQEDKYNKNNLARMLTEFSLGRQENLRTLISSINIPAIWIAGEQDSKFASIASEIPSLNKNIKSVIVEQAGHRVPWENPEIFISICKNFIATV